MQRQPILVFAPLLALVACGGSPLAGPAGPGSAPEESASSVSSDAAAISADLIDVYDDVRVAGLEEAPPSDAEPRGVRRGVARRRVAR